MICEGKKMWTDRQMYRQLSTKWRTSAVHAVGGLCVPRQALTQEAARGVPAPGVHTDTQVLPALIHV